MFILLLTLGGLAALVVVYWLALKKTLGRPSRADELYAVTTADLWKIRLHRFKNKTGSGEPVLLCHGAMTNHLNYSAPASANLVKTLTERGYDCWILELRGTRSSEPPPGRKRWDVVFDDYVLRDLPAAIEAVASLTDHDQVHYVGHSLGGMVLYAYALTHDEPRIASAATLGTPPGFAGITMRAPRLLLGIYKTFPGCCERLLRALTPLQAIVKPPEKLLPANWRNMHPDLGTADYFNMIDAAPPPLMSQLAYWAESNAWRTDRNQVDVVEGLKRLSLPLLAVFGRRDPFTPEASATEFFEGLPGKDKKLLVVGEAEGSAAYGHCDLALGRNAETDVFEPIAEWFAAHPISAEEAPKKKELTRRKMVPAKAKATKETRTDKAPAKKKSAAKKKPAAKKKTTAKKKSAAAPKKSTNTTPDDEQS